MVDKIVDRTLCHMRHLFLSSAASDMPRRTCLTQTTSQYGENQNIRTILAVEME